MNDALPPGDDTVARAIAAHPFAEGMDAPHVARLAAHAGIEHASAGGFLLRHGQPATRLLLLTGGAVALEIARPGRGPLVLETLHAGDAMGWSWLFPPHVWHLDARALDDVSAVTIAADGLRGELTEDPTFCAVVTWRIAGLAVDRLRHARAQLALQELP